MNKKVCLKISGLHITDNYVEEEDEDGIEVITFGNYYKRNGKHYVRYEEPVEKSDIINTTILKIGEQEIEVITKGVTGNHMVFTEGRKNTTFYATPFGALNLAIDTYDISVEESEDRIYATISYGLEMNLNFVSECTVKIEVESIEE